MPSLGASIDVRSKSYQGTLHIFCSRFRSEPHRRCTIDNATSAFTDEGDERASSPSLTGATGSNIADGPPRFSPYLPPEKQNRAAAAIKEKIAQPHTHTHTHTSPRSRTMMNTNNRHRHNLPISTPPSGCCHSSYLYRDRYRLKNTYAT